MPAFPIAELIEGADVVVVDVLGNPGLAALDGSLLTGIPGGGDVVGPAGNTAAAVALYSGITGKLLQDGPVPGAAGGLATLDGAGKLSPAQIPAGLGGDVIGPAGNTAGALALYDGVTGKLLQDGPVPGAALGVATLTGLGTHALAQYLLFVGDAGGGGSKGAVPGPAAGDAAAGRFLHADGSWQIPVGATGNHSLLSNLLVDTHTQYFLLLGRLGGQTAIGGTAAGEILTLRGSSNANLGLINVASPLVIGSVSAAASLQTHALTYNGIESVAAFFVGGGMDMSPSVTFTNSVFIWEGVRVAPNIQSLVAPGFAAFTLLQALPLLRSGPVAGQNPLNATVLNAGPVSQNEFAGTRTVSSAIGVSYSPQVKTTLAGAVLNRTFATALRCGPTYSTVVGSTVALGAIRGLDCVNPVVGLFQPGAGTESLTSYYGLHMRAISFGGNVPKAAVWCDLAAASNAYLLNNPGGAQSDFGGGDLLNCGLISLIGDTIGESILLGAGGDARIHFDGQDLIINAQVVPSAGAVRIPHRFEVSSTTFPAALIERVAAATVGVLSGFRQLATSTGNMGDTFGPSVFWSIQDDALLVNNIGYDSCVRFGGADDTGQFRKFVYLAGVATEVSRIDTTQTFLCLNGSTFRTGGGRLKQVTRIAAGPYTVLPSDHVVFVDTDGGPVTVNLPPGVVNTEYRIVNVGSSGNDVTLAPDGVELLFGVAASTAITDGNDARVGYEATEGWF